MTHRILIIEDDEMVQAFIALHLENEGYMVSTAGTGGKGLGILAKEEIDLLLLDLNLPDGDGLSVAQKVRETSSVPIMILTARKGQDDRLMGLSLGVDEYLTKPVDPKELFLRVRNILSRSGKSPPTPKTGEQAAVPPIPTEFTTSDAPPPSQGERKRSPLAPSGAIILILGLVIFGGTVWWFIDRGEEGTGVSRVEGDPSLAEQDKDPDRLPEVKADRPLAATSFSWVLRSKCDKVPYVSWWRVKTHADIVGYVIRRHAGNWKPYLKDWTTRLIDLQDSYSRGNGIRTPKGEVMTGKSLKGLIDKTQKRVDVMFCLSREAADYSYRKNLPTR